MKNLLKTLLVASMLLGLGSTFMNADVVKGKKLFQKKLKNKCGMTGAKFAATHSQDEWEEIHDSGKMKDEIMLICPNANGIKDKYLQHFYDFSFEFANDSGNVPSC